MLLLLIASLFGDRRHAGIASEPTQPAPTRRRRLHPQPRPSPTRRLLRSRPRRRGSPREPRRDCRRLRSRRPRKPRTIRVEGRRAPIPLCDAEPGKRARLHSQSLHNSVRKLFKYPWNKREGLTIESTT